MSDEPSDAINLFIQHQKDINQIREDVTQLIKEDLGLGHKMDMVLQAQEQMREGFGHSRETGHKTWEAVQRMSATVESLAGMIKIQEGRIDTQEKLTERVDKRFDKIFIVGGITIVSAIIMLLMTYLSNKIGH